ncbi:MAG: enoyl-CoA hydratase/isomerase family protein, partial [Deltaproteobacteria bacterium]
MRVERSGQVAVLRLENGKANSISPSFLERLQRLLGEIGDARAAVMIGQGSAFSAGLDLPALVALDRAAMRSFILGFDEVMLRVFELPVPLVAAVNGHAVAGGC